MAVEGRKCSQAYEDAPGEVQSVSYGKVLTNMTPTPSDSSGNSTSKLEKSPSLSLYSTSFVFITEEIGFYPQLVVSGSLGYSFRKSIDNIDARDGPTGLDFLTLRYSESSNWLTMEDLDESIQITQEHIDGTRRDHPLWAAYKSHLGRLLRMKHESTHDIANLDDAILVTLESIDATLRDHPNREGD
ncbi:hypothetical protein AUP68_13775 [Ilyonectria robusta]